MISKALKFSSQSLNQYLKNSMGLDEDKVVLNNLIESNGELPKENQNKVVISLINIEQETNRPFRSNNIPVNNNQYNEVSLSEKYNLDILISANFDDYEESLKFLDAVLLFFQINPSLDARYFALMPEGLTKLEFDIEKIAYSQMHNLWTAMGAKYQPSLLYKIRLVTIQGNEARTFNTAVLQTTNNVAP